MASSWASAKHDGAAAHQQVVRLFNELSPMEDYWSYPGPSLMLSLRERLDAHDAGAFSPLVQKIGRALLSNSLPTLIRPRGIHCRNRRCGQDRRFHRTSTQAGFKSPASTS